MSPPPSPYLTPSCTPLCYLAHDRPRRCHVSPLQDIFERFFNLPTGAGKQVAPILRLMWLLFILAKAELLGALPDLVSSFNLLVCVANTILAHIPRALGTVDFNDKVRFFGSKPRPMAPIFEATCPKA